MARYDDSGAPARQAREDRVMDDPRAEAPGCGGPADTCVCENAVKRAVGRLRGDNQPDSICFEAAMTIFRWHHPEHSKLAAERIISAWMRSGWLN